MRGLAEQFLTHVFGPISVQGDFFVTNYESQFMTHYFHNFLFRMIKAILIFNNQGKPRMTKFYQRYSETEQQSMIEVSPLRGTYFGKHLWFFPIQY